MASLPDLQARFAAALRGRADAFAQDVHADGLDPVGRLKVYRNNARAMFEAALERTYPVARSRVGEDYFRQLAHSYREQHPSHSGDLHWVGRRFPAFLSQALAGTGYEWLAELAELEWACETAMISAWETPCAVEALAGIDPERIADVALRLQPSLACVASAFPVLDVWKANQPGESGAAVDLGRGGQHVLVACGPDGLELRAVARDAFEFTRALKAGAALGAAVDAAQLAPDALPGSLGMLFEAGLVTGVSTSDKETDR